MNSDDERQRYAAQETRDWALRVMGSLELDVPELFQYAFVFILMLTRAQRTTITGRMPGVGDLVTDLLSPVGAALISAGISYEEAASVFERVAVAIRAAAPSSIEVVNAVDRGTDYAPGRN